MEKINSRRSDVFFIDGSGGTDKTFFYRALFAQVRPRRLIALATTTFGVAVVILLGGRTTHSRFILSLNLNDTDFCDFSKQDGTIEWEVSLIIWDEAPMEKIFTIEMVDQTLRDIMDNTFFFYIQL